MRFNSPVVASQILAVLSSPPEAIHRPSGLHATPQTWAVWPRSVNWGADTRRTPLGDTPLGDTPAGRTSQMLTVLSSPGATSRRPSGLNATLLRAVVLCARNVSRGS